MIGATFAAKRLPDDSRLISAFFTLQVWKLLASGLKRHLSNRTSLAVATQRQTQIANLFFALPAALILLLLISLSTTVAASDVIVVCPQSFRQTLEPWLARRRDEGLTLEVIPSMQGAERLQSEIRRVSAADSSYVVLVGDAPVIGNPCDQNLQIPILYQRTTVTSAWGSTPTLSSDLLYGDFDQDGMPEAAVGRMPVDDAGELRKLIERIVQFEQCEDFGLWRSQVDLVGGVGGFGVIADAAIESVTRNIVTGILPVDTRTRVAYASPGHAFCPIPKRLGIESAKFTDAVLDYYGAGSRFWVYAGHGQVTALDRVPANPSGTPVLDRDSVQRLSRPKGCFPIALLLACYTGAMDAAEDSIAEEMLRCQGGPIAVIAGSRVTMPYGNTTAAVGLIEGVFEQQLPRLGDAWLNAVSEMHQEKSEDESTARKMIDGLALVVSPAGSALVQERREHMALYNLMGDPTLRMNHPQPMLVETEPGYTVGEQIEIAVQSSLAGKLTVSLDRALGSVTTDGDANNTSLATLELATKAGEQRKCRFQLTDEIHGPITVRAHVAGKHAWASGATKMILHSK